MYLQHNNVIYLLSGDTNVSMEVLDTDIADGMVTVSGLFANTTYILSVVAISVGGQSDSTVITAVTSASGWLVLSSRLIVVIATVAPVLAVLASIGVYTCVRYG